MSSNQETVITQAVCNLGYARNMQEAYLEKGLAEQFMRKRGISHPSPG